VPSRVHVVAGARPNFMKVAPLHRALRATSWCRPVFVHTGQHYDDEMSGVFLRQLGLPAPDITLGAGSGRHGAQTARVMTAYEEACLAERPDWIVVVGDVNSTLACALVAAKLCIPFAHLEAGLRSRDRRMPEEVNRLVTDVLADVLWTPSPDADENLRAEGIPPSRIEMVGNIMIDSYELLRETIDADTTVADLGLEGPYAVVTLHRPSNVDEDATLSEIVDQLVRVAGRVTTVFPVHPRTAGRLEATGLRTRLEHAGVRLIDPLDYVGFVGLVRSAQLVVTDSGGIQEETTYLSIPCITVRDTTERPITVELGTNVLASPAEIDDLVARALRGDWATGRTPPLWDGRTAERITRSLAGHLGVAAPA
jgi:UDP-N-acetylglucosamine 2-epimerase (non-hydrolysing)